MTTLERLWAGAAVCGLALGLMGFAASDKVAMTPDQEIAFTRAERDYYQAKAAAWKLQAEFQRELTDRAKQLQVQLSQQQMAESAAEEALKAACPGELSMADDTPACKPKVGK